MRSKPELYVDYNSQIYDFVSLFRHSEWFSFPVKQFPSAEFEYATYSCV